MFKKRKLICILFLFSCIFICMSFVSADNITNDTSYNNDNNTPIVVDSPTKSFSDLKNEIYDLNKSEIILEDDYVNQKVYDDYSDYYPQSDMIIIVERVTTGILINRSVNIDGQGHIIDANNLSEIFYLNADNITLKNIVFKNAHGFNFGAVFCNASNISIINCTFINNYGITGAVYCNNQNISIINSTFINNTGTFCAAAIMCEVPVDIINSAFINNNGNYDYSGVYSPVICSCKSGRIINSTFFDNYVYNSDEEKYAGIYYYDMIFNVVNETITYSENSDKVRSIIVGNFIIINSTFNNTLTHNIHYYRQLLILNGDNNNTTETSNNSRSNNQSTSENNINSTNNAGINKTSDVSEHVVPVNFNVDNNMSQITPIITIIANNTYVIGSVDDIIEIGFKTNINKMFWVEILGLLSKTNITSNDFYATIKLSNITKGGEYAILCGFYDYVKPVVVGSDEIIGVADKKTIHINNNNSTSNNQSTIENNTNLTNNTDANKTTGHNTEDITENDINNLSVPSNNSDIGSDNKNQTSSVQNQPITPVVKTSLLFKPVNVKKTAKKLVLQIVLKQGSKLLKGKKITFMFNGKKYTAKTNKKGIAKVIIKKKVLKKLKVGKKVKYQVSYGKIVAKKTVKVKK